MRAGLEEEEIPRIITTEVALAIREAIPELFGSVKTVLIEEFDWRYVAVTQVVVVVTIIVVDIAGFQRGRAMQYREFSYTNPLEFRVQKPNYRFEMDF